MRFVQLPLSSLLATIRPDPNGEEPFSENMAVQQLLESFSISLGPTADSLQELSQ